MQGIASARDQFVISFTHHFACDGRIANLKPLSSSQDTEGNQTKGAKLLSLLEFSEMAVEQE